MLTRLHHWKFIIRLGLDGLGGRGLIGLAFFKGVFTSRFLFIVIVASVV
jgi:hypothetical protein